MASNRINRINEEIMKELSSLLRTVKDPRVQDTMISITRVETTPDLRYTKVYVSFLQSDRAKQAMVGLKSAGGYLRRELGHALQLRYAPEIVWAEGTDSRPLPSSSAPVISIQQPRGRLVSVSSVGWAAIRRAGR